MEAVYREVDIEDIAVDHRYQRELNGKRAIKLAELHDPRLEGTIELSQRPDGKLYCIVGQHRVEMYRKLSVARVTAKVWTGLAVRDEAFIFERQPRTEKPLDHFQLWRARLVSRDETAVAVQKVIDEYDGYFALSSTKSEGKLRSVSAVEAVYTQHGEYVLRMTLMVLRKWTSSHGVVGGVIRGLGLFIASAPSDVMLPWLIDRISMETHADAVRVATENMSPGSNTGGYEHARAMAESYFLKRYNSTGSRGGRRPAGVKRIVLDFVGKSSRTRKAA